MKRLVLMLVLCAFLPKFPASAENSLLETLKNPVEGMEIYGDFRYRRVYGEEWYLNNAAKDGHQNYDRIRARLGAKHQFTDEIGVDFRMVQELWCFDDPEYKDNSVDFDEAIIDRLNVKLDNFLDMPVTAVVGRQDIILSKWLVLDGTPLDGSRTIFFDAARFTVDMDEGRTLDLVYTQNYARASKTLEPFSEQADRRLTQNDEQGVIMYYTDKSQEAFSWEAYFMLKEDDVAEIAPRYNPDWSRESEIYTFGGAFNGGINDNMSYRLEAAVQTGEKAIDSSSAPQDLEAFGTLNSLCYSFNDEMNNMLTLEYEYLSGDNPSTDDNEGFDPLWGEWPRYSEMYVYTQALEGSLADHTNLHRVGLTHKFDPAEKTKWTNAFHLLWAAQDRQGAQYGGDSDVFRGQLLTSVLRHRISKQFSTRLNAEYFIPGNYYDEAWQNESLFLRAEVVYSF
ncbi:alginate export family protein [Sedimentisphaera salicampi]|uniref:alginate export family protein n=1 Tax=Sedimentisphaera salicampi TaxID=1941349 RepID=UPI000B9D18C5|nr:alginate export family protein [Sedimentisphaera salicampi]OXU14631.1 hypothetical protein SMSP1_01636 [Sedimentisphaera salicampi]